MSRPSLHPVTWNESWMWMPAAGANSIWCSLCISVLSELPGVSAGTADLLGAGAVAAVPAVWGAAGLPPAVLTSLCHSESRSLCRSSSSATTCASYGRQGKFVTEKCVSEVCTCSVRGIWLVSRVFHTLGSQSYLIFPCGRAAAVHYAVRVRSPPNSDWILYSGISGAGFRSRSFRRAFTVHLGMHGHQSALLLGNRGCCCVC